MHPDAQIWQEECNNIAYRLQTQNETIHHYLSQIKDFTLVGWGINVSLWIYRTETYSIQKTKESLNFIEAQGYSIAF